MSKKKTVPGIFRFVSMLFLIFEEGDEQKNCARYFQIRKYAFFPMFEKKNGQKNCARYFQIHKYAFFILEKGDEQKNCQVFSDL